MGWGNSPIVTYSQIVTESKGLCVTEAMGKQSIVSMKPREVGGILIALNPRDYLGLPSLTFAYLGTITWDAKRRPGGSLAALGVTETSSKRPTVIPDEVKVTSDVFWMPFWSKKLPKLSRFLRKKLEFSNQNGVETTKTINRGHIDNTQ